MKRGWLVLMYQKICWLWELKQKDYIGFDLTIQGLKISILRKLFGEKISRIYGDLLAVLEWHFSMDSRNF